jgi:hypothetical protein
MRRAVVWKPIAVPVWVCVFTVLMVVDSIVGVWRKRKVRAHIRKKCSTSRSKQTNACMQTHTHKYAHPRPATASARGSPVRSAFVSAWEDPEAAPSTTIASIRCFRRQYATPDSNTVTSWIRLSSNDHLAFVVVGHTHHRQPNPPRSLLHLHCITPTCICDSLGDPSPHRLASALRCCR